MLARRSTYPSDLCPVLARVSGIPATRIEEFSSTLCDEWLQAPSGLQDELAAARAELVERLHEQIRLAPPTLRRALLAVKRDAFNGRGLARHRGDPQWSELARLAGAALDRIVTLEERLAGWREEFSAAYRRRRAREHRALLAVLDDAGFRRGLALATPVLAEAAERARRTGPDIAPGRRELRLDLGLLRYVSRAALKLSPFSTLTRVALGTVGAETPQEPFAWRTGAWSERSLLRVRRYLVEQDLTLLCRYRPFREGLTLALSSSLEETAPGRYRFLRPERWVPDAEAGKLRHEPAALVEMNLSGSLVARILGELGAAPRGYRELHAVLTAELGDAGAVAGTLDALVEAGILLLETPWPGNEPHLEKRLLAHLRDLPADAGLDAVVAALGRLVALEEGFAGAAEPLRTLAAIDPALDDLWRALARLAGMAPAVERNRIKAGDVCEDVLLVPAGGPADAGLAEIFAVSRATVREIVRSAGPWARLSAFQGYRFDFLHTVAALLRQRWPDRREVSLLELFAAAQPLWREYRKFTASPAADGWRSAFNPLELAEVAALAALRTEIRAALKEILQALPPGEDLPLAALERLAARVPERYASPVGACLFVQPADAAGGLWVLNRIFEGTGRYGSRFTAVMDDGTRRRYAARFARAAVREVNGEPAELLDLMWSRGDTLNVHAAQTARVLAIPGETLDCGAAEPVALRDLRVALDGDTLDGTTRLPRLVDAAGRRLLPVHLGGAASGLIPFLLQFLAQWGPGEVRPLRAPAPERREGAVRILERLTAGNLVLARRRWVVAVGEGLRREVTAGSEEEAFAALNRWRIDNLLPESLFWIEKTHYEHVGVVHKPQYLNFTSPLFVEVFRSALRANGDPLTFEERLPAAGDLPYAPGGERWAVELQLDTLPLGPPALRTELAGDAGLAAPSTSLAVGGRSV
jgi:hypothetical protein